MRPPCELVVKSVLPAFRSLIAKKLIQNYRFSQVAAAAKLGTTQPSISHYIHSNRGEKMLKQLEASPSIMTIANEVAEDIATNRLSAFELMLKYCRLCQNLRSGDLICDLHKEFHAVPNNCDLCKSNREGF